MNWKQKLGIKEVEAIFSEEIDNHFKDLRFYEHTMDPRFYNVGNWDDLTLGVPVLRFDANWNDGGVQRVFMNQNEIYVERQTNYRSYDGSSYHKFETPPTSIEEIEEVLNSVVKKSDW